MTSPQPRPSQSYDEEDEYDEGESVAEFDDQETYGDAPDDPEFGDPYDENAFQYCFECNRSYPTEADLVDAYNTYADDEAPEVTSGSQVTFCPECMHDFLYPPSDASPER
ncbi:hypothetical protein [Amycolatopsis sp. RTGN1]|uniref:hypothetical protein n=1 Tax=Amycolatopsis ponsaeliensis TaxID=2992142 RepID=UPI00254D607D|nr:hypothetical protein [Amycolatopsis sp. RTGN1]